MSEDVFDFRKPGRLPEDIAQLLSQWQQQMRSALQLRWARQLPFPFQIVALPVTSLNRRDLSSRYDHEVVTYRLDVGDDSDATVIILPRRVTLGLVNGILGDISEAEPVDRVLTNIEKSLAELLVHEIETAVKESQPFSKPLTIVARGEHRLEEMHKEFPETEPLALVSFEVELPFGKHTFDWALSQAATLNIVAASAEDSKANRDNVAQLEQVVREIPMEVVVRLGEVDLPLAELAELRVGDVVVLDQRIVDPLTAAIGGCLKFIGWPGRVGSKQAYQIKSVMD